MSRDSLSDYNIIVFLPRTEEEKISYIFLSKLFLSFATLFHKMKIVINIKIQFKVVIKVRSYIPFEVFNS